MYISIYMYISAYFKSRGSQLGQLLAHFILICWSSSNLLINIISTYYVTTYVTYICIVKTIEPILKDTALKTKLVKAFERLKTHFPNDQTLHDRIRRVSSSF